MIATLFILIFKINLSNNLFIKKISNKTIDANINKFINILITILLIL